MVEKQLRTTEIYEIIQTAKRDERCHILGLKGGRGSSKTHTAIQDHLLDFCNEKWCNYLFAVNNSNKVHSAFHPTIISVINEYNLPLRVTESPLRVKNQHGRVIYCSGFDDPEKVKVISKIGRTLMDEVPEFAYNTVKTIWKTTREVEDWLVTMCWNPTDPNNWVKIKLEDDKTNRGFVRIFQSTCESNPFLPESVKDYYRSLTGNERRIDYLGEYGVLDSELVLGDKLRKVGRVPDEARFIAYGLDYSNGGLDPHSLVELWFCDMELFVREVYQGNCPVTKEALNGAGRYEVVIDEGYDDLLSILVNHAPECNVMQEQGVGGVIADRANPANTTKLSTLGVNIEGYSGVYRKDEALRGLLSFKRVNIVGDSPNLARVLYGFKWKKHKSTGDLLYGQPDWEGCETHAIDATLYGLTKFSW